MSDQTPEWLTPEWLVKASSARGYHWEDVKPIRIDRLDETVTSSFFVIRLRDDDDHRPDRPRTCLLKVGKPKFYEAFQIEAKFYGSGLAASLAGDVPACYGIYDDQDARVGAVLMTHIPKDGYLDVERPLSPPIESCEACVRLLARIHAHSRRHDLAADGFNPPTQRHFEMVQENLAAALKGFVDRVGDELSGKHIRLLEQITDAIPGIGELIISRADRHVLTHGDTHWWNFMIPTTASGRTVLFDWQGPGVSLGVRDLSYMMGMFWFRGRRQRFEKRMLDAYREELDAQGMSYAEDNLLDDYRLLMTFQPLLPSIAAAAGHRASSWWVNFQRAMSAFEDHQCHEFVQ